MNNILGKKIELKKGILGTIVVVLGLLGLLFAPSIISIFSLTITGFIAFTLVFGKKDTKKMFSKPVAPVKNIAKYFFINVVISAAVSVFLQQILKWGLTGNP
ncbi:TPA: CPBP family intramembrane glutamate endopeptidase, partial [Enterococcus faecium]